MIKHIVDDPGFFLVEFISILVALILWTSIPGLTWQPLLVAISPLLLRIFAGRPAFKRTPFDIPIGIFLLTAGVALWAAYQPEDAWIKFWFILISILFYYQLARQPAKNLWTTAGILCLMGFGMCIFFFLSNNWEVQIHKFQLLSQIGIAWMRVRPDLGLQAFNPNDLGGIAALTLPFSITLTRECWRRKSAIGSLLFGLMTVIILATILLSSSRGTWMAVAATVGLWILWELIGRLVRKPLLSRRLLYILFLTFLACIAVGYIWTSLGGRMNQVAVGQAGVSIEDQRFHVFWSDIELIKDVPFTGGGLDSFPGLYSTYILINPNYILGYGHNILLDATLQQGILSGIMLLWIYMGSILWLALQPSSTADSLLGKAIISSLLIILFHGLVDDIVYRTMYIPLLFFVPGMAVGLAASGNPVSIGFKWKRSHTGHLAVPILIVLGVVLIGLIAFHRPLLSAWYTDLGAVKMAKVELSDFPTGFWDEGKRADLLSPAESLFNRAIIYEPANPSANYRLGLIAMLKRDYPTAISHLEIARINDPYHRGILKALGLSYIWNGQIEDAIPLLSLIPESNQELAIYPWWWREQNRQDLATYAEEYLKMVGFGQ
jgi:O-antigen ligase